MTDILAEIINGHPPPAVLYHYTTQVGLLGIIGEGEIWATHTQYLNDRREYVHAVEQVRAEITYQKDNAKSELENEALGEMLRAASDNIQSINVCVCSFSENGDSLSQWRAYGESTAGFSIGFDTDFLARCVTREQFYLSPCVYDPREQATLVRKLVEEVLSQILAHRDLPPTDDHFFFWRHGGNLVPFLHRVAPAIKDKAFADEREWRIISRPVGVISKGFAFRPGKSMITPYYKIPLFGNPDDVGRPRVRRIVVGPTPNPELSKRSVRSLILSERLERIVAPGGVIDIDDSTVPYRSW